MIRVIVTVAVVMLGATAVAAQRPLDVDPGRAERTREDLERLRLFYEGVLESPAYSERLQEDARATLERIRRRLTDGDFRLGDRIILYVQGEPGLPDSVAVEAGPMISLPLFGDVALRGVLRSEIESHLTEHLRHYIREPVVRAQGLMRVSIQGAVLRPGFYVVPANILVGEAVMVAGGPAGNANVDRLRVERGQQVLVDGEELQAAVRGGLTLDQLNLQAGDQIVMPGRGGGLLTNVGLIAGLVGSLSFLILQLTN